MKNRKIKHIRKILCGFLCTVMAVSPAVSASAAEYDEYGAPIVTATPTPVPHTEYYDQAPDTDSIEGWPQGPKIEGESAILVDMVTGAVLYSKNADKVQYPASITKIMTSLLAAEHLNMKDKIVMSQSAAYGITISDSSSIYADTGEEFTTEQAMMAVMLQSANEMTLALAEETSGSVKKFVELMNLKAKQLGCTGTHFNNPNGLPDELHYTTASDMAKIARAAWYNPTFRKYTTTTYYEIPPTNKFAETRYLLNHHKMMKGNTYAYEGVMGGKTGYTDAAGNTLVTYAKRGNMRLVSVVMKSINGAYADTAALLDYGFNNFTRTAVKTEPETMSVSYLPAEKYILKDYKDCTLCHRYQVPSVTLPNGADISTLNSSRSLCKNSVGLPILEITYSFNGQRTGCAKYYFETLLSDRLISSH
ncbi:MAG: D-alanyl-D-alanine carboxypeptidase family protein [Lachnospiraceae bacterium]|nr:D-alanyl-D-alanine carboxypeptidase family protein [Lachnospiraceae bacterium]